MRLRSLWFVIAMVCAASACSESGGPNVSGSDGTAAPQVPTEAPTAPSSGADEADREETQGDTSPGVASDRIVVVHDDQIATMLPDGSDRVELTTDPAYHNALPTWSPDATRIAWTKVNLASGLAEIATSRFDGSAAYDVEVDTPPFYFYWDPGSRNLAYLSPVVGGIDLGVVDIAGEGGPRRIDRGQPYYFSWNPDGDEMLVHASSLRLDRIDLEGATVIIDEAPGSFQAPEWTSDARALIYSHRGDQRDLLVSSGTDGEGLLELASYDGYLTFVVSPATNRIAVQVVDPTNQADPGVVTAGAQPVQPPPAVPEIPTGQLVVIATFGGEPIPVSTVPTVAFFWSPDGESLAWVEPVTVDGALWYQWFFLTLDGLIEGPVFRPSDTLLSNYFPFFDQFAKAITFWSPEGDQFVFAGSTPDGQEGVFVADVTLGGTTERIADGEFAAWSPTAAGDAATSAL